jgi:hypothetical protein
MLVVTVVMAEVLLRGPCWFRGVMLSRTAGPEMIVMKAPTPGAIILDFRRVSRIREMIDRGYFAEGMGHVPGEETVPEPVADELVIFRSFSLLA